MLFSLVFLSFTSVLLFQAQSAKESKAEPMMQRNAAFASVSEVWKYITELGISKVNMTVQSVKYITELGSNKVNITVQLVKYTQSWVYVR